MYMHCASSLSHVQLFVTTWTVARQAPLPMGILQARILEWVAMPSSGGGGLPNPGIQPRLPTLQADSFPSEPLGKSVYIQMYMYNWSLCCTTDRTLWSNYSPIKINNNYKRNFLETGNLPKLRASKLIISQVLARLTLSLFLLDFCQVSPFKETSLTINST